MKNHAVSSDHVLSAQKWTDSKVIDSGKSVLSLLRSQHAKEVEKNRRCLKLLLESVAYLSEQNISFQGYRKDRSDLTNLSDENR